MSTDTNVKIYFIAFFVAVFPHVFLFSRMSKLPRGRIHVSRMNTVTSSFFKKWGRIGGDGHRALGKDVVSFPLRQNGSVKPPTLSVPPAHQR
jgi:hypothetical protein